MNEIWETINSLAQKVDSHFGRPDVRRWTRQALKLREEAHEVAETVDGALGANPRKGHSHSWDDVRKETCDVALTALVMLAGMGGDPRWFFEEHVRAVAARSENGGAPV